VMKSRSLKNLMRGLGSSGNGVNETVFLV
jgi:hypothetical protein